MHPDGSIVLREVGEIDRNFIKRSLENVMTAVVNNGQVIRRDTFGKVLHLAIATVMETRSRTHSAPLSFSEGMAYSFSELKGKLADLFFTRPSIGSIHPQGLSRLASEAEGRCRQALDENPMVARSASIEELDIALKEICRSISVGLIEVDDASDESDDDGKTMVQTHSVKDEFSPDNSAPPSSMTRFKASCTCDDAPQLPQVRCVNLRHSEDVSTAETRPSEELSATAVAATATQPGDQYPKNLNDWLSGPLKFLAQEHYARPRRE